MRGREKRVMSSCVFLGMISIVAIGPITNATCRADGDPNKVRQLFDVTVESVEISAKRTVNRADDTPVYGARERTITITLRLEMPETNGPLAIDTYPPAVLGAWDAFGHDVAFHTRRTSERRKYAEVRQTLANGDAGGGLRYVPSTVCIDLVLDPNQVLPSVLSVVEGEICALYAEDIIAGDVPFKVTGVSVDVADGLEISVSPKTPPTPGPIKWELVSGMETDPQRQGLRPAEPLALWMYETYVRSTTGSYLLTLDLPWDSGTVGTDYVLIKTQLAEGKSCVANPSLQFAAPVSDGCECVGQMEQDDHDYDTIRHIIAVRPVEVKIPFSLREIPVPSLQQESGGY